MYLAASSAQSSAWSHTSGPSMYRESKDSSTAKNTGVLVRTPVQPLLSGAVLVPERRGLFPDRNQVLLLDRHAQPAAPRRHHRLSSTRRGRCPPQSASSPTSVNDRWFQVVNSVLIASQTRDTVDLLNASDRPRM